MVYKKYYLKTFLILFLCLSSGLSSLQAQIIHGVVRDSVTKEPVPFANVTLLKKDRGVSCDVEGRFEFDLNDENDDLLISSVGYENKVIRPQSYKGELHIALVQKALVLNEVVIDYKKKKYSGTKHLGLSRKYKVQKSIPFGTEFCSYIENTEYKEGKVKAVYLDLKKEKEFDYQASYNIRFYEYDKLEKKPGKELYGQNLIVFPDNKTYELKIDVDSLNIIFPRNGICVGVEVINTRYEGKLKSMAVVAPRILFTHTERKIITWNRYRNKEWRIGTTKSQVRKDFVNAMINIDVVIEK